MTIRPTADLLPPHTIAGKTLTVTLAIMAFLSALALGAADLLMQTSSRWQGQINNEITLQVKAIEGRDIEKDIILARDLLKATKGIISVNAYSKTESIRMLEPWLGAGATLDELPVPRLIAIKLANPAPDLNELRDKLKTSLPNSALEDHKPMQSRLKSMAFTLVALSFGVVFMTLATGVLTVIFATRAAVAVNGAVVEVLHFVGAKDRYIARQFERRFFFIGLKGAVIGLLMAVILFFLLGISLGATKATAVSDQITALFGDFNLSILSLFGAIGLIIALSLLTALTSHFTVMKALSKIE